ncbi:hypothetical protein [Streptomyces sp. KAI-26]|nr:hypothetical protein [Streptomyces sp. KAI-26]
MADSIPGATICPDCGEGITLVTVDGKTEPRHITVPGEPAIAPK